MASLSPATLTERQRQALPGSPHEQRMATLKWLLPTLAAGLLALIVIWPLTSVQEFSFLLAKDRVEMAAERMRIASASYRGETARGEPFLIEAERAVQKTSAVPEMELSGLSARLDGSDGQTVVTAPGGLYFMNEDRLRVNGPIGLESEVGYTVATGTIEIDMNERRVTSTEAVSGRHPMGDFRADALAADLQGRVVALEGNVRLRIRSSAGRGRG
jgi:lipopolysaccharide export system protein LptC